MFYIKEICPVCHQGSVGFFLCSDQKTIVLMSDEIEAVWLDPEMVTSGTERFPDPPDYIIPGTNYSVLGGRWATREEIESKGWGKFIKGEGKALNEY